MLADANQAAALLSVGHAVPPHRLLQSDAAAAARRIFAHRYAAFERIAPVFENAGIATRHAVRPVDWYSRRAAGRSAPRPIWRRAAPCSSRRASRALTRPAAGRGRRHHRHRLVDRHRHAQPRGARARAAWASAPTSRACRCSAWAAPAASPGWRSPPAGAGAAPGSNVLLVVVELCTLAFRLDQLARPNGRHRPVRRRRRRRVRAHGRGRLAAHRGAPASTLWPDTLDIMGWNVDPTGFGVIFDRAIPPFAEEHTGRPSTPSSARIGPGARRHRPLRLPSRRRQGGRGLEAALRPRPGLARP